MSTTPSVVHVVAPAEIGGLESVVEQLVVSQRAAGRDARVLAILARPDGARHWRDALSDRGVPVDTIVSPGRQYVAEWRTLVTQCRRLRNAIVHTHGYRADVIAGDAARRSGMPTISTVHGFTGGDWKNRLFEHMQRRALRRFDAVVAVSRPMRDLLAASGIAPSRLHAIPNAFASTSRFLSRDDARQELGIHDPAPRIGWVGRLSREKGPDVMLDAFATLARRDARLSFIGDGPERARLETQARTLGIADRVAWHGSIADARLFLRAFDMIALSSRTEGTPVVLLEAMAAAVPIVATCVGGIPDVVDESQATLVAPNDPGALARALHGVLEDANGATARAERASQRLAAQYAVEPWLGAYDRVYEHVAAGERRLSA